MKRLLSSWQGLFAGVLAVALYVISPDIIRWQYPTAGTYDGGELQWILLATVVYLWGVFLAWVGWQIAFRSIDRAADKQLDSWFENLSPAFKWIAVQVTFTIMWIAWFVSLKLCPV